MVTEIAVICSDITKLVSQSRQRCPRSLKSSVQEQFLNKFLKIRPSLTLNPYILIVAIVDIKFDDPIVFKETTAKDFATSLKGKKVVGAKRWGKYFWYNNRVTLYLLRIEMESPPHPVLHFGVLDYWR